MKILIDQEVYDMTPEWCSYVYLGTDSHRFSRCAYAGTGGFSDKAYITADDSQWTIDTPESPESILALIIPGTMTIKLPPLDLRNTKISFALRGDNLQLHGAKCYFWVVTFLPKTTRWHYLSQPLNIPEGEWSELQMLNLIPEQKLWHCSFSLSERAIPLADTLTTCMSFDFSFIGFTQKVTGKLSLSEFTIHQNLDTNHSYFAAFHNFSKWWTLSRDLARQIPAPVGSVENALVLHDENYLVLQIENKLFMYLAFVKRVDSTRFIQLHNKTFFFVLDMLDWHDSTSSSLINYQRGNMHFFIENTSTNTIWITRQPIRQGISIGRFPLYDNENYWMRLSGNAPLNSVMAGESHEFGYDYLGFMLVGIQDTPTGYWRLAEFYIL